MLEPTTLGQDARIPELLRSYKGIPLHRCILPTSANMLVQRGWAPRFCGLLRFSGSRCENLSVQNGPVLAFGHDDRS